MHLFSAAFSAVTGLVSLAASAAVFSLLTLAAAAWLGRRAAPPARASSPLLLAVIVPAHNEALVLSGTLHSLKVQQYPRECFEVVVVADNCTDETAALARAAGATVLERTHADERGKGFALNHAIAALLARPLSPDGIIIVDADTWVAPDFLARMSARLHLSLAPNGLGAWQGRYGVLNFGENWRAGLMAAAFDLVNHVKPLGRENLGLSVGLKGNGMAFTRAVAAQVAWPGGSLTEDLDYGLELLRRLGVRVGYAHEARVLAQMPVTAAQAGSQRSRWERGRLQIVRERALPLVWEGVTRRNRRLLDMGGDLLVPPLAELGALVSVGLGLAVLGATTRLLPHPSVWLAAAALNALGLCVYILGGLSLAGAPKRAYTALLRAPFYAVWKFALLLSGRRRRGASQEWIRTERAPLSAESAPTPPPPAPAATIVEATQP